jgi:hypothetical protein
MLPPSDFQITYFAPYPTTVTAAFPSSSDVPTAGAICMSSGKPAPAGRKRWCLWRRESRRHFHLSPGCRRLRGPDTHWAPRPREPALYNCQKARHHYQSGHYNYDPRQRTPTTKRVLARNCAQQCRLGLCQSAPLRQGPSSPGDLLPMRSLQGNFPQEPRASPPALGSVLESRREPSSLPSGGTCSVRTRDMRSMTGSMH